MHQREEERYMESVDEGRNSSDLVKELFAMVDEAVKKEIDANRNEEVILENIPTELSSIRF